MVKAGNELIPDTIVSQTTKMTVAISLEEDKMKFKINNMIKAYATISDYCSTRMQQCIWELSNYTTKIINNPIALLTAIKELRHSKIRAKYPYATLTNAFQHLINIKQQENKELLNYTAQFKQERDVLKIYTGN